MAMLIPIVIGLLGPQAPEALAQVVHYAEESFDKTTFSQMTQVEARQRCVESLRETIALIEGTVDLTPQQRDKLISAGELDIHRFFTRYNAIKRGIPFGSVPRDQWQQLSMESRASVRPFSRRFLEGLHGPGSLLEKTIHSLLGEAEIDRIDRAGEASAREHYAEQIDSALLVVGRQVGLSPERRQVIREKLLQQTRPPAMFGTSLMPLYFVLANMGEIEEELRELFTEEEWRTIAKLIEAGRTATR